MRFTRKHEGGMPSVSSRLTPMIDVVFLLLIYFVVTATFAQREDELASALRAETQEGGASADLSPQVVRIEMEGGVAVFRIGTLAVPSAAGLRDILDALPKESGVFVRVADDVSVDAVAAALQACRDAGFTRVSYVPAE